MAVINRKSTALLEELKELDKKKAELERLYQIARKQELAELMQSNPTFERLKEIWYKKHLLLNYQKRIQGQKKPSTSTIPTTPSSKNSRNTLYLPESDRWSVSENIHSFTWKVLLDLQR